MINRLENNQTEPVPNVDGHFQKAGFDPERIYECHGSIHHLQCHAGCPETWLADDVTVERGRGSTRCSN
jgi:NAD-dependent SIR2 family protein deacetylase